MSIFKETFKDFVFRQLRIREAIIEQGNDPKKFRHRFGNPQIDIKGKKTSIAAGAFYTNTVHKQCVIRMSSGVDVNTTEYLEGKENTGDSLAKAFILEGGLLKDNKPRAGFTTTGINPNPAYGDSAARSDAKDGFGIVPMPGIIDADIRTKTAYGSLREAKVNFVCHNRRQLEALELLYMRPGFPILLEWQWAPFINEKGKIDNKNYGIKDDWFDKTKTINELNLSIINNKELSSGNYDGFIGFCKNFEIVSRPDGGYNCTTEIIAAGEVLESLKSRSDGFSKKEEDKIMQIDNMQMLLEGLEELGELHSNKIIRALPNSSADSLLELISGQETRTLESIRKQEGIEQTIRARKLSELELNEYNKQEEILTKFFKDYDEFYLWKGDKIGAIKKWYKKDKLPLKSKRTYVRWDHLCDLINSHVFPLPNPDKPEDPLIQLTYVQSTNGKYDVIPVTAGWVFPFDNEQYIEYASYEFPEKYKYKTVDNYLGRVKKVPKSYKSLENDIPVEELLNNSFDPSICLLPNQNKKAKRYNNSSNYENAIGHIYLSVEHLLKVYMQMAYSNDQPKDNFNFFDYIKKIWEDVNKACVGNHNFILQTELERPNRIRIIDLQVNKTSENIKPEDLFEFKIQSSKSIVRDFNFNTTIPSGLTATIGIAAQAPTSVSDLDQVTFSNFSKGIKSSFTTNIELSTKKTSKGENLDKIEIFKKDLERYKSTVVDLALYQAQLINGDFDDQNKIDDMSFSQATSLASTLQKQIISLLQRNELTGERKPVIPSRKSAVIPLKFNVSIDGVSGIIIGNVFKVEKEKLPKGYQADDIAFVVMSESQKITSGQDWTTELSGQLMLLDLGEEETNKLQEKYSIPNLNLDLPELPIAEPDNTRVVQPIIEDEIIEDTAPTVGDIVLPETLVGNTGLTQEQIDNGELETTKRRVNGKTPYDYAYLIQAAKSDQNGAIKEEFFKGNTSNVNILNSNVEKLKQQYGSVFQYNFNIGDFPSLDNQNVGSAFSTYDSWMTYFTNNFSNLV